MLNRLIPKEKTENGKTAWCVFDTETNDYRLGVEYGFTSKHNCQVAIWAVLGDAKAKEGFSYDFGA